MKNRIGLILMLLLIVSPAIYAQSAELIGDTIEVSVNGFKEGQIQWQISNDSVIWQDIDGAKNKTIKYVINDDSFFRCKISINKCIYYSSIQSFYIEPEKKIYGVRIDRNKITDNNIERIYSSKGKITFSEIEGVNVSNKDDFDQIYPFNQMKLCNITKNESGKNIIIYENETGFSREQDTFVEIPFFYMKRYFEGNLDYRLISKTKYDGFYTAPMFIEGDKTLDKVYIAVYETSVDNLGNARSVTGKLPKTELTLLKFRDLYKQKGVGYSALDIRSIMSLEHLFLIRFANKNSQSIIGEGWVNLRQPSFKIYNNGPSNKIVIAELENSVEFYWFKNQRVCTVKKNDHDVSEYAILNDYIKNSPAKGYTTFIVDKTLNFDTTMYFGSSAQLTGWSDVLNKNTGRTKQVMLNKENRSCSVKLFGIENLWGNAWEMVDGLYFKGLKPYVSFDMLKYDQELSYEPIGFNCIEQFSNNAGDFGYISNLGIDNKFTWLSFPDLLGGIGIDGNNGYGDYFYQSNELVSNRYSVFGGGFDHFSRAGMFNFRNWNSSTNFWYLYGSRMQFKFLNQ